MKDKLYAIGTLVLGLAMVVFGISVLARDSVQCNGETMQQGDTCVAVSRGTATTSDLNQQRRNQLLQGITLTAVGGLMTVGGVFWVRSEFRTKPTTQAPSSPQ